VDSQVISRWVGGVLLASPARLFFYDVHRILRWFSAGASLLGNLEKIIFMPKIFFLLLFLTVSFSGFGQSLYIVNDTGEFVDYSDSWSYQREPLSDGYYQNTGGTGMTGMDAGGNVFVTGPFSTYKYFVAVTVNCNGKSYFWNGDIGPDTGDKYFYFGTPVGPCTTNAFVQMTNFTSFTQACYVYTSDNVVFEGPYTLLPYESTSETYPTVLCDKVPLYCTYSNLLQIVVSNPPSLTTNIVLTAFNSGSLWGIYSCGWTDGTYIDAASSEMTAPGGTYSHVENVPVADVDKWGAFETGMITNTVSNGGTNSVPSGAFSNAPPPLVQLTNSPLPVVTAPTTPIIWSSSNQDLSQMVPAIESGQQALYSAVNTAASQTHSDLSGVAGAVATGTAQSHSDATAANSAVNQLSSQVGNGLVAVGTSLGGISGQIGNLGNEVGQSSQAATAGSIGVQNAVGGAGSNIVNAIQSTGETNYALETTLETVNTNTQVTANTLVGISNLLGNLPTNSISTNLAWELAAGQDAASSQIAPLNDLASSLSGVANGSDTSLGSPLANWNISVPYMGGYTIDLNPFDVSWVVELAAFVRSLVKWGVILSLVTYASSKLLSALQAAGANRQATESGVAGILSEVPFINSIVAVVCATIVTAVCVAFFTFATSWFTPYMAQIATSPFSSLASSTVASSVWMADQFFPLSVIVSCSVSYVFFNFSLSAVVVSVQTITRYITG
jgi:hypothetical protein